MFCRLDRLPEDYLPLIYVSAKSAFRNGPKLLLSTDCFWIVRRHYANVQTPHTYTHTGVDLWQWILVSPGPFLQGAENLIEIQNCTPMAPFWMSKTGKPPLPWPTCHHLTSLTYTHAEFVVTMRARASVRVCVCVSVCVCVCVCVCACTF